MRSSGAPEDRVAWVQQVAEVRAREQLPLLARRRAELIRAHQPALGRHVLRVHQQQLAHQPSASSSLVSNE